MIIGIDIDGVLADAGAGLVDFHNENYGTNLTFEDMKDYDLTKVWGGTQEEAIEKVNEFYKSEHFKRLKPIEGAKEAVQNLSKNHDLVVITSRHEGISKLTKEWLSEHFPQITEIRLTNEWKNFGKSSEKSKMCQQLLVEVMIEDSLDYAKSCAFCGVKTFLIDCPWNQTEEKLPERVIRVDSWKEILKHLGQ